MSTVIEQHTVDGEGVTLSLMVWRRFHRPMPGLIERMLELNRDIADKGLELPVGTVVRMPIPITREPTQLDPIRLW